MRMTSTARRNRRGGWGCHGLGPVRGQKRGGVLWFRSGQRTLTWSGQRALTVEGREP